MYTLDNINETNTNEFKNTIKNSTCKDLEIFIEKNNHILNNDNFWKIVSKNHHLNIQFIDKYKMYLYNYFCNIKCYVSCEYIDENNDLNWDFNKMSSYITNCNIDFINAYIDKDWNYSILSRIINIKEIEKDIYNHYHNPVYQSKPWDWNEVSKNDSLTLDFVQSDLCKNKKWNYNNISKNQNIPLDKLEHFQYTNYYFVSDRTDLTEIFIIKHKNENWNMYSLSKYCSIDFINKYITDFNWNYEAISYNITLNKEFIQKNLKKSNEWDYEYIYSFLMELYHSCNDTELSLYIQSILKNSDLFDINICIFNKCDMKYIDMYYQISN